MIKNSLIISLSLLVLACKTINTQKSILNSTQENFTRQDTLRGSITPERSWWDLTYYHLDIEVDPDNKFIAGKNTIQYKVLKSNNTLQNRLTTSFKDYQSYTKWKRIGNYF